jgi:cellulose 1,4-beta-cellobiosidase
VETSGSQLSLLFKPPKGSETDTGSRVYLMASDDKNYEGFILNNKEFTFDIDLTEVPCGFSFSFFCICILSN